MPAFDGLDGAKLLILDTGEMFLSQMQHGTVQDYLIVFLWIYASMAPIMHGAMLEPFGIFTPRAELANGRAAMIAWASILGLEYVTNTPFF
jgi:hypothetical protein